MTSTVIDSSAQIDEMRGLQLFRRPQYRNLVSRPVPGGTGSVRVSNPSYPLESHGAAAEIRIIVASAALTTRQFPSKSARRCVAPTNGNVSVREATGRIHHLTRRQLGNQNAIVLNGDAILPILEPASIAAQSGDFPVVIKLICILRCGIRLDL
jgi:hypothetical protein